MHFRRWGIILGVFAASVIGFFRYCDWITHAPPPKIVSAQSNPLTTSLIIPRGSWHVYGHVGAKSQPFEYQVQIKKSPSEDFRWSVRKDRVRIEIRDHMGRIMEVDGKPVVSFESHEAMIPSIDTKSRRGPSEGLRIPFRLDPAVLSPGIYTIEVSADIDATDSRTGAHINIPKFTASNRTYMPPKPRSIPSMKVGQKFLFTADESEHPYMDATTERPVPSDAMIMQVLTLVQVKKPWLRKQSLYFTMDRYRGRICTELPHGAVNPPGMYPLVEDDTLDDLRRRYEGKMVWQYGGANAYWSTGNTNESVSVSGPASTSWLIHSISRVYVGAYPLRIGYAPGFIGEDTESSFADNNPLFALLSPSKPLKMQSISKWIASDGNSSYGNSENEYARHPESGVHYLVFADAWDFERAFSTIDPLTAHPEWSRLMRHAVMDGEIRKGMTRDMVVWVIGWPGEYARIQEMRTWDEWRYDGMMACNYMVYFRNGRVTRFGTDGTPP
ncbi:MAG: hypothetical protein ACYC0V_11655 [Armatimonadota bacterium]